MLPLEPYVRVSQIRGRGGERFISPRVQADQITAWAQRAGVDLAPVVEELDRGAGAGKDRPLLEQALARIDAGVSGGLVVAYIDRFSRSLLDGIKVMARVREAGGRFVAVDSGFDTATSQGELQAQIMLAIAEDQLRRIRGNWDEARRRAVERGIHPTSVAPFGYQRRSDTDSGLAPDPTEAPLVRQLFEMRAARQPWKALRAMLRDAGAKTRRGNDFSLRALRDIIRSDLYLGVARHGEFVNPGAHDAIVTPAMWRAAQHRGEVPARVRESEALTILGTARCAGCRYRMRGQRRNLATGGERWDIRCRLGSEQLDDRCTAPAASARGIEIDEHVIGLFLDRMDGLRVTVRDKSPIATPEFEQQLVAAQASLEQLAEDARAQAAMGMTAYLHALETRRREVDRLTGMLAADARLRSAAPLLDEDLRGMWQTFSLAERRRLIAASVDGVFVHQGGPNVPLEQLVTIYWAGEAPDLDLPRTGRRDYIVRPIDHDIE